MGRVLELNVPSLTGPFAEETMELDKDSLIRLICHRCDFYKDSDKDLECGAFKIIVGLLKKGRITPEEVDDALRE